MVLQENRFKFQSLSDGAPDIMKPIYNLEKLSLIYRLEYLFVAGFLGFLLNYWYLAGSIDTVIIILF